MHNDDENECPECGSGLGYFGFCESCLDWELRGSDLEPDVDDDEALE